MAAISTNSTGSTARPRRVLYLCDWLPPDFGAVGQYSLRYAADRAALGQHVVLSGLSSTASSIENQQFDSGSLTTVRIKRKPYARHRFVRRLLWTLATNLKLLWKVRRHLAAADEVVFTGSPPFMLHFLVPLNVLLRKELVYRISDFHPECLMASLKRIPLALRLFYRLTVAWRKRVHHFEASGEDQLRRLREIGIPAERITLKRDQSPVRFDADMRPLERPDQLAASIVLLYSGNFGVAHDDETFVEGYRLHHQRGGRVALWLNATGAKADRVEDAIREAELPIFRSQPVPLDQLARLLITPDAHLITLRDEFVGYVMPSKTYGCIDSKRPVLYIGSTESDIHLLCSRSIPDGMYWQIDTGDAEAVARSLDEIASRLDQPVRPQHAAAYGTNH